MKKKVVPVAMNVEMNIVDKILNYYKIGGEAFLSVEEHTVRERIDEASALMRAHNYDKELVRGMLVQKYMVSHEMAKNYIMWGQIIHAAFMELNVNYEMLWMYDELKKRISTADPKDKNYSKLIHAGRELLNDIDKKQAQQPRTQGTVNVTIKFDPSLLGLPADFDKDDEERRINELRRKAKKQLTGEVEDIEYEDVSTH